MHEFDRYAWHYDALRDKNIKLSGYAASYFDKYKIKEIFGELNREGLGGSPLSILNFGCGVGKSEYFITQYFPDSRILAVDVAIEALKLARQANRNLTQVSYKQIAAEPPLRFPTSFNLIIAANVFHHIPPDRHKAILRDLLRHLLPNGSVFMFEHNPYNPLTFRAVRTCPMDIGATLLRPRYAVSIFQGAGFARTRVHFTLFFPKCLSAFQALERYLHWLPIGAQYYIRAQQ